MNAYAMYSTAGPNGGQVGLASILWLMVFKPA